MYQMTEEMDAGPVYRKGPLSLEGSALDIYTRIAQQAGGMAAWLAWMQHEDDRLPPAESQGPLRAGDGNDVFHRRRPDQSVLHFTVDGRFALGGQYEAASASKLYDYIRMLDAPWLEPASLSWPGVRVRLSQAELKDGQVKATAVFDFRAEAQLEGGKSG